MSGFFLTEQQFSVFPAGDGRTNLIQAYWPDFIKEFKEFEELDYTESIELTALLQEIDNMLDDQFIATATENGIARREKLLGVLPFADDDIESRRFRIQAKWNDRIPYAYKELIGKLNNICGENGYAITLNSATYTLDIKIELTRQRMFDEVVKITRQIVPANILLTVDLRYNQHSKYRPYTNVELSAYTHARLRSEVID